MVEAIRRRDVLGMCAAGMAIGLAGCSSSESNGDDGDGGENGTSAGNGGTGTDSGVTVESLDQERTVPFNWPRSFISETTYFASSEYNQGATGTLRVRDNDFHMQIAYDGGQTMDSYVVGGMHYTVVNGVCVETGEEPERTFEEEVPHIAESQLSVTASGTSDGHPVYMNEVADGMGGTSRWYIHRDTGFPVRFESDRLETVYHSWDEVEPIEAPAVECPQ